MEPCQHSCPCFYDCTESITFGTFCWLDHSFIASVYCRLCWRWETLEIGAARQCTSRNEPRKGRVSLKDWRWAAMAQGAASLGFLWRHPLVRSVLTSMCIPFSANDWSYYYFLCFLLCEQHSHVAVKLTMYQHISRAGFDAIENS